MLIRSNNRGHCLLKKVQHGQFVMLNSFQHPVGSIGYETLNQVQGDADILFQQVVRGGKDSMAGGSFVSVIPNHVLNSFQYCFGISKLVQ